MTNPTRILVTQKPVSRVPRLLTEQGYVVDTAANVAEADCKAHFLRYDVVVLDLAFSGTAGLGLVKKWRTNGIDALVLVLASLHSLKNNREAFDAGADVLVMKPYTAEELMAQIRALLRRVQPRNITGLQVHEIGDLQIDISAHIVRRGGRTILLTRSECAMLHYLACNRGQVVSRSMIYQHLYGQDKEITSNLIDVRIYSLRRKIDKGFEIPLILTRWGVGYLLRGESP